MHYVSNNKSEVSTAFRISDFVKIASTRQTDGQTDGCNTLSLLPIQEYFGRLAAQQECAFAAGASRYAKTAACNVHRVPKKEATKLLAITFSNLNRFSKFFHCWK